MSAFRKIPELDWLKELADDMEDDGEENSNDVTVETARKIDTAYRYLLWLRRANLATPQTDEHTVAMGLSTKYNRRLYGMPINDYEKRYIDEAEALFKKLRRGKA